jgi:hypothetical protein
MSRIKIQHSQTPVKSTSEAIVVDTSAVAKQNSIQSTSIDTSKDCCDELLSELARYKQRCEKSELQCTVLLDGDRYLESMFAKVRIEDADFVRELRKAMAEIATLKRQREDRITLEPSVFALEDANQTTVALQIRLLFTDLKDRVNGIPARTMAQMPLLHKLCENSSDLEDLLRAVSGHTDQPDLRVLCDLSLQELIQALTGAAIRQWIFESNFQIPSLRINPLLQRYRDQITILRTSRQLLSFSISTNKLICNRWRSDSFQTGPIRTPIVDGRARLHTVCHSRYGFQKLWAFDMCASASLWAEISLKGG